MEKNTRIQNEAAWKDTPEETASVVLRHGRELMFEVKAPYQPGHKAYRDLALAASGPIRAFLPLTKA